MAEFRVKLEELFLRRSTESIYEWDSRINALVHYHFVRQNFLSAEYLRVRAKAESTDQHRIISACETEAGAADLLREAYEKVSVRSTQEDLTKLISLVLY